MKTGKTALEWFEKLPNDIKEKAIYNYDRYKMFPIDRKFDTIYQCMWSSFEWDKTSEGYKYWRVFCDSLNDDPINPSHYKGKISVIDFIEDKKLCYKLGNVIKYVSRAGKKDPKKELEDLQKAEWHLQRKIKQLKDEGVV